MEIYDYHFAVMRRYEVPDEQYERTFRWYRLREGPHLLAMHFLNRDSRSASSNEVGHGLAVSAEPPNGGQVFRAQLLGKR